MNIADLKIQVSRYILDESAKTFGKLLNKNRKLIDDQLVVTGKTFENVLSLARKVNIIIDSSDKGLRTIFYSYKGDEMKNLEIYVESKLNDQKSNNFDQICKQNWIVHTFNYSAYARFKIEVFDEYVRNLNEFHPLDKYIEPILKREKKIEVIDPPTDICFILCQLQKSGYIKFPTLSSGTIDLDSTVKALKKAFNITVPEDTIKTYFGPARMRKLKLKFDGETFPRVKKTDFVIPRKKKIN